MVFRDENALRVRVYLDLGYREDSRYPSPLSLLFLPPPPSGALPYYDLLPRELHPSDSKQ